MIDLFVVQEMTTARIDPKPMEDPAATLLLFLDAIFYPL